MESTLPTILVAEDERINQMAVRQFLEKIGHTVLSASNGEEVLEVLKDNAVDIILMDVQMPRMDGVQASRAIRTGEVPGADTEVPIVALTAYAMHGDRERFLEAGMNDYLSKPYEMEHLAEKIRTILHARNG